MQLNQFVFITCVNVCVYIICSANANDGQLQEIQLLTDLKGVTWCLLLLDLTLLISSQMLSSMYISALILITATDCDLIICM